MTKSEIKAELRRSAVEDTTPYHMNAEAFIVGLEYSPPGLWSDLMPWGVSDEPWRTFALLVAEAL